MPKRRTAAEESGLENLNVNAHGWGYIADSKGIPIARCPDTPNPIALAFILYPEGRSFHSGFPNYYCHPRSKWMDRITSMEAQPEWLAEMKWAHEKNITPL